MNHHFYSYSHKICDPIHGFIRFDDEEKRIINSRPFQRLRYIHQMGIAYLIYPGATHKRFEHSLGVMELATRIYDSIIASSNSNFLPSTSTEINYWRKILRIAALCHDLGHLPFSHTAEQALLLNGGHERITLKFIQSPEMRVIWQSIAQDKDKEEVEQDIIKLALSVKELSSLQPDLKLTSWEKVLSQTITDDNFGADRIDYLIRDAYFTGVGYGHFDYHQLMDTLRIVQQTDSSWTLGVFISGLQSVESLWIARYLMYARVYHHPKSRIYSKHLSRFMENFFAKNGFPANCEEFLFWTDYEILSQIAKANDKDAHCLMNREQIYEEVDLSSMDREGLEQKLEQLKMRFGEDIFIDHFSLVNTNNARNFPVLTSEGKIISSTEESSFLRDIPLNNRNLSIFAAPHQKARVVSAL